MIAVKKKRFITTIDILKIVATMFMAWQHLVILLYSTLGTPVLHRTLTNRKQ